MIITILNGNPETSPFDTYLTQLSQSLEAGGHQVTCLLLRDLPLRHCVGCWGCWVKTPGECVSRDASLEIDRAAINADFLLWAAPLMMGYPSELLKKAMDKSLPLIHPYIEVAYGEAHHAPRYAQYPRMGLLVERESSTDERDLQIVADLFSRTAVNFKSRLEFSLTTQSPIGEVAGRIANPARPLPLPRHLGPTQGVAIHPPVRLTLFNGSPRGRRGNTPIMLDQLAAGFGRPAETFHLVRMKETGAMVEAFAGAECAILGFPLYTDAMPAVVKHFVEALAPLTARGANPPLGFLVQSGFPEGLHSRYVERYLEKLAARLGSPYLGTIVKGNGEGTRVMPPNMTQGLYANLQALGAGLASDGRLDLETLQAIAKPEAFPAISGPFFQFFLRLPWAHGYFDQMLRENGAYARRSSRPFAP
jgi:multimeric flavodoxin WrbA